VLGVGKEEGSPRCLTRWSPRRWHSREQLGEPRSARERPCGAGAFAADLLCRAGELPISQCRGVTRVSAAFFDCRWHCKVSAKGCLLAVEILLP